jgi:type I restriction enzyme R subunit
VSAFTESVVEDAALAWLENLGHGVEHGPEITPGKLGSEHFSNTVA